MDTETKKGIQQELYHSKKMDGAHVDFNILYGDLCRKLLSTPVGEIFPEVVSGATTNQVTSASGSTSPTNIHPAFPAISAMAPESMSYLTNIYSQNALLMSPVGIQYATPKQEMLKIDVPCELTGSIGGATSSTEVNDILKIASKDSANTENIDIQKLVDEFRITLERYGVSQRFAARFIMQDTSQGNLSFLMEKGRNKRWEELSPRGRLPYIKMKSWLESKEHQMWTIDMLKHSQDTRKNSPREAYNRRERFSMFQLNVLCRLFEDNSNPPMNIRNAVADRLGIPLDRINVWFQNQRARGFPARKILQQTIYDNGNDSYLALDVENMKDIITKASLSPQGNSTNIDTHLIQTLSQNKNYSPEIRTPISATATGEYLNTCKPIKSEPEDTVFPLDLSSSFSNGIARGTFPDSISVGPSTRVPTTRETSRAKVSSYLNNQLYNVSYDNGHVVNSSAKPVTSGAAKRKRGSKPHQIISTNRNEANDTQLCSTDDFTKRRKVIGQSGIELKYNYRLDTFDSASENVKNKIEDSSKGYEYVIKSDISSPPTKLFRESSERQEDEARHKFPISNVQTEHDKSSISKTDSLMSGKRKLDMETRCDLPHKFDMDTRCDLPHKLNMDTRCDLPHKKDEMTPKSVELFKAMCASIAKVDGQSVQCDIEEPDLD